MKPVVRALTAACAVSLLAAVVVVGVTPTAAFASNRLQDTAQISTVDAPGAQPVSDPVVIKPNKTRYVVAAMGDSLTDPRSHGGKYLEHLSKVCPESVFDSYGKGGNMVNQMRRRFERDVFGEDEHGKKMAQKPSYSHVLILGGINDICSDETALRTNDKIERDLALMYESAKRHGAKVIALTLPPWAGFKAFYNKRRGESTLAMNRWITKQKRTGRVDALFDVYPLMSCGSPSFLCEEYGWPDKVHWNKAGHKRVGKALHQALFSDCK